MLDKITIVENIWQRSAQCSINDEELRCLSDILTDLDSGKLRVAYRNSDQDWIVSVWVKQAIILMFRHFNTELFSSGGNALAYYDKFFPKTWNWGEIEFKKNAFRLASGANVRKGAYIAPKAIILPSFINIGAYIDEGTMIDSDVTIGSCAQIGKFCHISTGVKIGGVLEPKNASPVIIEDNVFIGAGSQIVEGVVVREGAIVGMGVMIGASTRIVNRETGKVCFGHVPRNAVVVPGSYQTKLGLNLACAVIIKEVDTELKNKLSINEYLRDAI